MNDAATIISNATGCTLAKAQRAVVDLLARGWTPPDADRSTDGSDAAPIPAPTLPGFSAVNANDVLLAHTDGGCSPNPGPGGWAVVFSRGGEAIAEYSGSEANSTNNRMELLTSRQSRRHSYCTKPRSVP
jgi:hypothetical protein